MQNLLQMSDESRSAFNRVKEQRAAMVAKRCSPRDADLFWVRLERYFEDVRGPLRTLYGDRPDSAEHFAGMFDCIFDAYLARPEPLRLLDLEREITPDWFERENMLGYVCYPQFFAGRLEDLRGRFDYLEELGITYLHLMSMLKPRPGKNDGGYAVMDYRALNPEYGDMSDMRSLTRDLRERGIALCVDLVLNHTAREHDWAQRAIAGDPKYMDYYLTFPDRTLPDVFEPMLQEVFPDEAPGNFTFCPEFKDGGSWVWTTFYDFQWDLNYANPTVFRAMLETVYYLVNQGIDILRLDAAPFIWKRQGTNCQNQPEVFLIIQAIRASLRVVAPSVILKAEAIVPPDDLMRYIGVKTTVGKQCELAYNNQLMVNMWSGLATRNASLLSQATHRAPRLFIGSAPVNYVRNHDDIGWAMADQDLAAVGEDPAAHRRFLNEFYTGQFPGSFARGSFFQYNPNTGDARICGTTASLAGLEMAIENKDEFAIDLAIRRILLLHSLIMARGGVPLIYMGDEVGLLNDQSYLQDPEMAHDSRWLHRPRMDWEKAARRHDPASIEGRIFSGFLRLIRTRKSHPIFHNFALHHPMWTDNQHVMAFARLHHQGHLLILANFDEHPQSVAGDLPYHAGLHGTVRNLLNAEIPIPGAGERIELAPCETLWLVEEER